MEAGGAVGTIRKQYYITAYRLVGNKAASDKGLFIIVHLGRLQIDNFHLFFVNK
jgi:CTP synthase (UTP-ammonia lyase)